MHWLTSLLILLPCCYALPQRNHSPKYVRRAFTKFHIVPDVIPSFNPVATLDVIFKDQSTGKHVHVAPGKNLTVKQTETIPQFLLKTENTSLFDGPFVIALVDPDAPKPQDPKNSPFRHMLGGDFRVKQDDGKLVNGSVALTEFAPPSPPDGSDPHR
ncbi:hypothetical protein HGRIS_009388 [Hohenbuehelia grisea]|uniref:Uncharacterized protein n=1 Tax=Hohenbuehelia grisea TaxID=104357 RepID=A0ABR3J0Z0_9AGAR